MRYILDTNVLSEVMRQHAHPSVTAWLRACQPNAMFTTAVSQTEIYYGIRLLPEGARRQRLERAAQAMFADEFPGRILPFDTAAAETYADLRVLRRRAGLPVSLEDGMIAAIAHVGDYTIVTRDIGGFAECGVALIDPWAS